MEFFKRNTRFRLTFSFTVSNVSSCLLTLKMKFTTLFDQLSRAGAPTKSKLQFQSHLSRETNITFLCPFFAPFLYSFFTTGWVVTYQLFSSLNDFSPVLVIKKSLYKRYYVKKTNNQTIIICYLNA